MATPTLDSSPPRPSRLAFFLGITISSCGLLVLLGWATGTLIITRLLPRYPAMTPLTAVSFLLLGLTLCARWDDLRRGGSAVSRRGVSGLVSDGGALAIMIFAALVLGEHLFQADLGIARLLFPMQVTQVGAAFPGRPAASTALNLFLSGAALLLARRQQQGWVVQALTIFIGLNAARALLSYLYALAGLAPLDYSTAGALPTLLLFGAVAVGILALHPRRGLVNLIRDTGVGGSVVRPLLIAAAAVPLLSELLALWQRERGLFGPFFEIVLVIVVNILAAGWFAAALARRDRQQRAAAVALREQAELLDQTYDPVLVWELDGAIVFWNRSAEQLYGFSRDEAIGQVSHRLLRTASTQSVHPFVSALTAAGRWEGELQHSTRDGRVIVVESRQTLVRRDDGRQYVLEVNRDITGRRQAEQERTVLLAREHAARAAAERAAARAMRLQQMTVALAGLSDRDAILAWIAEHVGRAAAADAVTIGLLASDGAALELLHLPASAVYHSCPWRRLPLDQTSAMSDAVRLGEPVFVTGPIEREQRYPGPGEPGGALHAAAATYPLRSEQAVIGALALTYISPRAFPLEERVFLDTLTQLCAQALNRAQLMAVQARERLAKDEAHALLDTLFATAPTGLAFVDRDLCYVRVNAALAAINGLPVEAHLGKRIPEVLPHLAAATIPFHEQVLTTGQPIVNREVQGESPGTPGEQHTWLVSYYPVPGPEGRPLGVGVVVVEVTAQRRLQAALAEREAQLGGIIDSAMDAIITIDAEQRIVLFNATAERVFGYPPSEILGQPLALLLPEAARAAHHYAIRRFEESGVTSRTMGHMSELRALRRDGTEFPIEASISSVLVGAERLSTVILRDVTARKQLEAQYLQAQRMETVGRLAGGIAHDFNNLLTVIGGYAELVHADLPANTPSAADLAQIQDAVERARRLTQQLLAFARKQVITPSIIDLNALIRDLEPLLQQLLGADVTLTLALDEALGLVQVDPSQLEQVIVNLAVNARDAMPGGGRLAIQTANVVFDGAGLPIERSLTPGSYVMVRVSDTGAGIPPELQPRVFEPFFSTKSPDKGSGLGLATCYGIVQQHRGAIALSSEPGQGTTVTIYLPQAQGAQVGEAAGAPRETPPQGSETVLLVEDEAAVRALAARVLRQRGYTVLEAANGAEGLRLAEAQTPRPIDLLVTDVVMPELGGPELAERLGTIIPGLRVLFISGYTDHPQIHEHAHTGRSAFLQKPFSPAALAHNVRAMLDAR